MARRWLAFWRLEWLVQAAVYFRLADCGGWPVAQFLGR